MDGVLEVFQYLAPVAIILGTATMALVHNHQIKELGLEKLCVVFGSFLTYQLLVEGEIDFVSCIGILLILLIAHLMDGVVQRLEILLNRLVYQHVAVGQVEHLLHQARLQQAIDNLEGGIGLSCTCSHYQ